MSLFNETSQAKANAPVSCPPQGQVLSDLGVGSSGPFWVRPHALCVPGGRGLPVLPGGIPRHLFSTCCCHSP